MSYRRHLASVVMALLEDDDDRDNTPLEYTLFSEYPSTTATSYIEVLPEENEFLEPQSSVQDFLEPQNDIHEDVAVDDPPPNEAEDISPIGEQEVPAPIVSDHIVTAPEKPIETVQESNTISVDKLESNQSQSGVWRRRSRGRYCPSSEEPLEKLTSMSVQGLDCSYVTLNDDGLYQCMKCAENHIVRTFKHKYSFQRHAFLYHEGIRKVFPCPQCNQEFSRPDKTIKHMKTEHHDSVDLPGNKSHVLFQTSNLAIDLFKTN